LTRLSSYSSCLILLCLCFTSWIKGLLGSADLVFVAELHFVIFPEEAETKRQAVKCLCVLGHDQGRTCPVFLQALQSLEREPQPSTQLLLAAQLKAE